MRCRSLFLLFGWLVAGQAFATCPAWPWQFGMSPQQITSITECGPYKAFKNGDLETYNGLFEGEKENFQFYFKGGKLYRIAIHFYEGTNPTAAANAWLVLYRNLSGLFGKIETPGNMAPAASPSESAEFKTKALAIVRKSDKTQMAPVVQPKDTLTFSSLWRHKIGDEMYYYVVMNVDPRPQ